MRRSHRDQYKLQLPQTNTLFTCYTCDKSFTSSDELSQHQATHNREEKPFNCSYCRKNFFTFTELNKHRRHECIQRRCPCRDCGALFPNPSRLRNHRIAVHPQRPVVADDIDTYQCCKCSCGFQTEEELLQHQEIFANDLNCETKSQGKKRGRKPKYAAQMEMDDIKKIKQQEEAEEGSLRAHKREEHGPLPRKALTCIECEESYTRPEQLKIHMARAHRAEYTCHTCGKSFARESILKIHQNTHTEGEEEAEQR
ncbi:hypothetical protein D5F01_LYC19316 [Larimichthys crocea]|uniref:C2H2-type domain-containing protein n=2 Tax=Larimichthys crocea TaxID=215358 RepID=A0A6G0HS64_LARCR|nr:hypothetical protein D5F01_LYC19316 [Larimichthys crocea]